MPKQAAAEARDMVPTKGDVLPDFMREDVGKVDNSLGREDLEVPRLKLMQALSPELQEYNDLRPGNYLNTATGRIISAPIAVTPVYVDRSYILWNPRDAGGGILARAADGVTWRPRDAEFRVRLDKKDGGAEVVWRTNGTVQQSGLADWGSMNPADPNSPPAATLMYNYLFAFPGEPDETPAVLTFQRSSIKVGRHFNTICRAQRVPMYGGIFELTSNIARNKRGQEFYVPSLRRAGIIQDAETYSRFKALNSELAATGLDVGRVKGLQDDDEGSLDGGSDHPAY